MQGFSSELSLRYVVDTTAVWPQLDHKEDQVLNVSEISLDPQGDEEWSEFAADAHAILDHALQELRDLRSRPAWAPMPQSVQDALDHAPFPLLETPLKAVHEDLVANVFPYTSGNRHPRAWGWVRGQGSPVAVVADMISSALNAHLGSGFSAPLRVEQTVTKWLAQALDFPAQDPAQAPSGLLTSGASTANLLGLAIARKSKAGYDVRAEGLSGRERMVFYCSIETHGWVDKAVELLGLGRQSLRRIPVDHLGQICLSLLRQQIVRDRANGMSPVAVIANAGTVNTGAVDDLVGIRSLCNDLNLWMHVDGAFAAWLNLAPSFRHLVAGIQEADSLAFDLHKWLYLPFGTGCLLVKDEVVHRSTFQATALYMEREARGMLSTELSFTDLGFESSRDFKALRVWMQLKVHGFAKHARLIEQNMQQAMFLEELITDHDCLELLVPRRTNVVCFRYVPPDGFKTEDTTSVLERQKYLNDLTRRTMIKIQELGRFILGSTTLASGDTCLRVAITNHRSRKEDFLDLVENVSAVGTHLHQASERFP